MLFQQSLAIAHQPMMPLDENLALWSSHHASRGKRPRTHRKHPLRTTSKRITPQQRIHLSQRQRRPIRRLQRAFQAMSPVVIRSNDGVLTIAIPVYRRDRTRRRSPILNSRRVKPDAVLPIRRALLADKPPRQPSAGLAPGFTPNRKLDRRRIRTRPNRIRRGSHRAKPVAARNRHSF
jgi:hypothetical protein